MGSVSAKHRRKVLKIEEKRRMLEQKFYLVDINNAPKPTRLVCGAQGLHIQDENITPLG